MSNYIRSYRDLMAWQKAFGLCFRVYGATEIFPPEECFCLTQQIRQSAISVPSNVAEGARRLRPGEFIQSLDYPVGPFSRWRPSWKSRLPAAIQAGRRLTQCSHFLTKRAV